MAADQSRIEVDPAALWLCQLPAMTPALALKLIEIFGSADGVIRASSGALRAAGVPSAMVSRIVGGARAVPQVAAGVKVLHRLGISPLPLPSSHYPDRLRALREPPLVLYLHGPWPITQPLCLLESWGALDPSLADAWAVLQRSVSQHVAWAARDESAGEPPRVLAVPWGLMLARQRLTSERWQAVRSGATTLLSPVAPATHGDVSSVEAATDVLIALADAIVLLPGAGDERLMATARALGRPIFALAPPRDSLPAGVARIWGVAGARRLRRSLGIHAGRGATAQQERLF